MVLCVCIVVGAPPVLIDSTDAAASWDVDDCMSVFLVQFRLKVTNATFSRTKVTSTFVDRGTPLWKQPQPPPAWSVHTGAPRCARMALVHLHGLFVCVVPWRGALLTVTPGARWVWRRRPWLTAADYPHYSGAHLMMRTLRCNGFMSHSLR